MGFQVFSRHCKFYGKYEPDSERILSFISGNALNAECIVLLCTEAYLLRREEEISHLSLRSLGKSS